MSNNLTLESPITLLKGVGPVVAKGLQQLNIVSVRDLLQYFPRKWDDFSTITQLKDIKPGIVAVHCNVERVDVRRSQRLKRLTITEAILSDGTGTIKAVWFNQPFLLNTLKKDERYLFAGNFEFKGGYLSLNSPKYELASEDNFSGKIYSIYPETKAITSKILQKLIAQVIDLCSELDDCLPANIEAQYELIDYVDAVRVLHQPSSMAQVEAAKYRLGFAELFELIATSLVLKKDLQTEESPVIEFDLGVVEQVTSQLNFDLTDAQRKVTWQIFQDLQKPRPMNRMLEGDVGSGKTLVALLSAIMSMQAGYQVALMVPTEILARQHIVTFQKLLKPFGKRAELLISALKKSEKTKLHANITSGKVNIIIGTHALLSEGVEFDTLGLVIIDEQHRFGVNQRRLLKTKASFMPHVLTMTATPIPRSLALVVYGDLDVSVIDQLPVGRKPVATKVASEADRSTIEFFVDQLLAQGQQAFVVCPTIEQNVDNGMKSVDAEYTRLQKTIFAHRRIARIHGKLKSEDKAKLMADFRAKKYDILLATTVIEVGVDIPDATVLIVENAERFGLATLHQLRGRVGRNALDSYCYLFSESDSPQSFKRLQAMEKTTDGFRLAQIDLELRGPGEIYGTSQHGVLDLRFANLFDTQLLSRAKEAAKAFVNDKNMVKYQHTMKRINTLKRLTSLE